MTALDHNTQGKQFILTNHDGSTPSKVILARQDSTPGKVFLTTPDAAGVNQLFFTTPDLSAQHLQVNNFRVSFHLTLERIKKHIISISPNVKTLRPTWSVGKKCCIKLCAVQIICGDCPLLYATVLFLTHPHIHIFSRVSSLRIVRSTVTSLSRKVFHKGYKELTELLGRLKLQLQVRFPRTTTPTCCRTSF